MNQSWIKTLTALLLIFSLLSMEIGILLPAGGVDPVQAAGPGPNIIIGFLRFLGAWGARNRLYREANATSADINAYYDQLVAQAQETRSQMIRKAAQGEEVSPLMARAYVRAEAALEAERAAAIELIEQEKNQARLDFRRTATKQITNILIASPGGQHIVGQVRDSIAQTREAAVAVQIAAEGGKPIEALSDALAAKVGGGPVIRALTRQTGSIVGHRLDQALGGAFTKISNAMTDIQGEMGSAIDTLDQLDADVAKLDSQAKEPLSVIESGSALGNIIPVDRKTPVLDVLSSAWAGAAALSGSTDSRSTMRSRIREALLQGGLEDLQRLRTGSVVGQTYCTAVGKGEYETAASQLGDPVRTAENPQNAVYLVCYDIETQAPVLAKLTEPKPEEQESPPTEKAGSSTGIPAGTYQGQIVYVQTDYILAEILGGGADITVADDGSITGTASFSLKESYSDGNGCLEQIERQVQGSLTGQVESTNSGYYNGPIELNGTTTITILQSCGIASAGETPASGSGRINFENGRLRDGQIDDFFRFEGN